jgi:tRNA dimethylallyltransferase
MKTLKKDILIVVVGPTAVGKTALSIDLAERLSGEIISADSQLFYRGLNIGTAKPTLDEMKGIPHHLIDVTDLQHPWSISIFKSSVYRLIEEITQRGHLPILVGGTGQYIRGVIENWTIPEFANDEKLRQAITNWGKIIGNLGLHQKLSILDPQAAGFIDYRNVRRTVRALEVIFRTGYPFSQLRSNTEVPFDLIMIGIMRPREELYKRVDERIEKMIQNGFIDEVKHLVEKGQADLLIRSGPIGYFEIVKFILGECSLAESIIEIKRKTRILVRRQTNWFKPDDERIKWFMIDDEILPKIISYIQENYPI